MLNTLKNILMARSFKKALADGWIDKLTKGANAADMPVAYIVAVASRETELRNIAQKNGLGRGIMQVDGGSHAIARTDLWETEPQVVIDYACKQLESGFRRSKERYPKLGYYQHLKVAAAGYNMGWTRMDDAVQKRQNCDFYTTGGDYGKDVMERMTFFTEYMAKKATT